MAESLTDEGFALRLGRLGPFAERPALAVAASGGADSTALAWLAARWVGRRGGTLLALVVDHGLRSESGAEARSTLAGLSALGIPGRLLRLTGLTSGPGLAARARAARYLALANGCVAAGLTDLLLGHHAGDQAETLMMRVLQGSDAAGFAGIAAQRETADLRLLRPLLDVPAAWLRATLLGAGIGWVEDPSNHDRRALRGRLRAASADDGVLLAATARQAGDRRAAMDTAGAATLAAQACLYPEGHAVVRGDNLPTAALAALLRMIGGAPYSPGAAALAPLAHRLEPATLSGVRILRAGRLGEGCWLLVREEAALGPPVPAASGALWDGRFRLAGQGVDGAWLGALGADAARFRRHPRLPAAVLRTLPALRRDGVLVAVPHLGYCEASGTTPALVLRPAAPAAGGPWMAG